MNWNTRDLLAACLRSIYGNLENDFDLNNLQVIVVDNCSDDLSAEMVAEHFKMVELIRSPQNLGFGRGNNLGWSKVRGDYLLLLNPDTELRPGVIQHCFDFFGKHPKCGAIGVRQVEANGALQNSCGSFPSLALMAKQNLANILFKMSSEQVVRFYAKFAGLVLMPLKKLSNIFDFNKPLLVDWVMGAFIFMPRNVAQGVAIHPGEWDQVAGDLFDPCFEMYAEEIDLCKRIRDMGWEIWFAPPAEILHYGGASTAKISVRAIGMRLVGLLRYYQKHRGAIETFIYRVGIVGFALLQLLARPFNRSAWQIALTKLRAALYLDYKKI